jgi:Tfp pilus assembly protein FimT
MPSKPVKGCGPAHPSVARSRRSSAAGWTLPELLLAVAIIGLIIKISLPSIQNTILAFRLSAAASTVAGAIQQNRYQAIMIGCPYTIAFTTGSTTYQVQTEAISGTPPVCASSYSNSGNAISWTSGGGINLVTSTTYTFLANGTVSATQNGSNCAMPCTFQLSNTQGSTNTISVSGVGYVKVTSP